MTRNNYSKTQDRFSHDYQKFQDNQIKAKHELEASVNKLREEIDCLKMARIVEKVMSGRLR